MALLFVDGFDSYATADITKKWTNTSSATIQTANGRRATGNASVGTLGYVEKSVSNLTTVIAGCAIYVTGITDNKFLDFRDAATIQCNLHLLVTGAIQVLRNDSTVLATSAVGVITAGTYHYIEFKATIHDTTGSVEVKVNGATVASATNVDTKQSANAYCNLVRFAGASSTSYIDDVYICDTTGSAPTNDFLGDCRVDTLYPNADGTYTSFTPSSGTDHYALVDETAPNTSDYVESSTAGHQDSYQMGNLSALTGTIYGVQVSVAALKDDAGARSLKVGVRSSSTNSVSAAQTLATGQVYYRNIHETDPATAAAWTESGVNAAQLMVENV
jgi:hypothetical protein